MDDIYDWSTRFGQRIDDLEEVHDSSDGFFFKIKGLFEATTILHDKVHASV